MSHFHTFLLFLQERKVKPLNSDISREPARARQPIRLLHVLIRLRRHGSLAPTIVQMRAAIGQDAADVFGSGEEVGVSVAQIDFGGRVDAALAMRLDHTGVAFGTLARRQGLQECWDLASAEARFAHDHDNDNYEEEEHRRGDGAYQPAQLLVCK